MFRRFDCSTLSAECVVGTFESAVEAAASAVAAVAVEAVAVEAVAVGADVAAVAAVVPSPVSWPPFPLDLAISKPINILLKKK